MRIAIYSDNFHPELSGITDTITTIGKSLAKNGHKLTYYVPYYSDANYRMTKQPHELDLGPNISVFRLPSLPVKTGTGQGRFVLPVGSSFSNIKKFDPDVIHFHIFAGAGLEAIMMAKLLGKPLVGTNHTPILEFIHYSPIRTEWFKQLALHYDSWMYNHCDFVSSPAQAIFDHMPYFHQTIPHRPVSNPINTGLFRPASKAAAKKKTGLTNFTVLFVSKLSSEKKVDLIIRAVAKLKDKIPDITLALTGSGAYEKELRALSKSLSVEDRVKFLGFVPTDHLVDLYNASEVSVMMSTAETQSIASMQSLACGVPVLAANAWGLAEYIKPEVGFLIEPGNVDMLAEKILLLHRDKALWEKMSKAGPLYLKQFSIPAVTKLWEEIYEATIKRYNKKAAF